MVAMEPAVGEVRFPEMRREIIGAIKALADPEYQEAVWVKRIYPHPRYYDDFDLNISILYDDTAVLEDPYAAIGSTLASRGEADALASLAEAINALLDVEGDDLSDADYINSPRWGAVVEAARAAYVAMAGSGQ